MRDANQPPEENLSPTRTGFAVWAAFELVLFVLAIAALATTDFSTPLANTMLSGRGVALAILGVAIVIVGLRLLDRWLVRFKRANPRPQI